MARFFLSATALAAIFVAVSAAPMRRLQVSERLELYVCMYVCIYMYVCMYVSIDGGGDDERTDRSIDCCRSRERASKLAN
jgi:hypothetical protein